EPVVAPVLAPAFAPGEPCVAVLCAAAHWLNDTASTPEISTGNNLRISFFLRLIEKYLGICCKRRARNAACTCAVRRLVMRKLLVLAAVAASFPVSAQTQVDAPGKRQAPSASQQAHVTKMEEERIRA